MTPITDPALIAQLNGLQPVTDPAVLAQLNSGQKNDSGLDYAVNTAGRMDRNILQGVGSVGDAINSINPVLNFAKMFGANLPSFNDTISKGLDNIDVPAPQTSGQRVFDMGVQSAVPTILTGGGAMAGLGGFSSGVAGQAAKEAGLGPAGQTLASIAGGVAPGGLLSLGNAAVKGAGGLLGDFVNPASQENIGKILASQAENPSQAVDNLSQPAPEYVPGSMPTTAEVAGDTGLISAQRAFENNNPGGLLAVQRQSNNAARNGLLSEMAGNPDDLERAIAQRSEATKPLYQAAKNEGVNPTAISPVFDQIDSAINDVGAHTEAGKTLLKLRSDIENSVGLPKQGPLIQTYKEARDAAAKKAGMDGAYSDAVRGVVKPIIHDLGQAMESSNDGLLQANSKFRDMSAPINQMETLQGIQEKIANKGAYDINGNPKLSLAKLQGVLSNDGRAELEKVLTPDQIDKLNNLQSDLKRQSVMDAYKPSGSDTAANKNLNGVLQSIIQTKAKGIPIVGEMISSARSNAVNKGLLNAYSNPEVARSALVKGLQVLQKESIPAALKRQMAETLLGTTIGTTKGLLSNGN